MSEKITKLLNWLRDNDISVQGNFVEIDVAPYEDELAALQSQLASALAENTSLTGRLNWAKYMLEAFGEAQSVWVKDRKALQEEKAKFIQVQEELQQLVNNTEERLSELSCQNTELRTRCEELEVEAKRNDKWWKELSDRYEAGKKRIEVLEKEKEAMLEHAIALVSKIRELEKVESLEPNQWYKRGHHAGVVEGKEQVLELIRDMAVVNWTYTDADRNDAGVMIHKLMCQAQVEALDPAISKEAQELINRGRCTILGCMRRCAQYFKWLLYKRKD